MYGDEEWGQERHCGSDLMLSLKNFSRGVRAASGRGGHRGMKQHGDCRELHVIHCNERKAQGDLARNEAEWKDRLNVSTL